MPEILERDKRIKNPVLLPTLGNDYQYPLSMVDDRNIYGQNYKILDNIISQKPGDAKYGTTVMASAVLHMAAMTNASLNLFLYRFSKTKSQRYNPGTNAWDDATKSGSDWTGDDTNFFDTADLIGSNIIVVTNRINNIQRNGGTGLFTDLGGTPPKCAYLESYKTYLVLADIEDGGTRYSTRVQWCNTGNPEQWTTGSSGSRDLNDTSDPVIGLKKLNQYIIAYKKKAIYNGQLVDNTDVFDFNLKVTGVGPMNNRSIEEHNGIHYFFGSDGNIYGFNGFSVETLGDEIREYIFPLLNANKLGTCWAQKMERFNEIWFYVTVAANDWPTIIIKFNYMTGVINQETCRNATTGCSFRDSSADVPWSSLVGTWAQQVGRWGDVTGGSGYDFPLFGRSTGYSYKYEINLKNSDGDAIDMIVDTKDFTLKDFARMKRWKHLQFTAKGDKLDIYYSTDKGVTWTAVALSSTATPFTLSTAMAQYSAWFDIVSTHLRIRFRNDRVDEQFELQDFTVWGHKRELAYK